ncbi:uncharacterized protein V1510DRAFT_219806 [Dipodascopsis tothii]|uniref:uncharacterized protein n=1 Tax=Dipodascopsis tothii TaxID=44089 RepID=UPI0034CE2984
MVKLKEIPRTAAFAWSPGSHQPFIASGTVAGAVDADFSSTTTLDIWDLNLIDKSVNGFQLDAPEVSINTDARFYDLAWGAASVQRPMGIIAGAQENGALSLWDPQAILDGFSSDTPMFRSTKHTGPIKSIDFNPKQANLLASAGSKGEFFVWDLDKPGNPSLSIGTSTSSRLDEIESIAFNSSVVHILATSGNTGFTSVWDLKSKREVLHLYYPGSSGAGRRGVSSVVWHPENSTKLITASEDDMSPVILMWDLRNANAPEKILTGHEKGVLSLSWCSMDSDLLLSCGKDNRNLLWNPQSGELLGEYPISTNWVFETRFNPRNPDIFATASFDGKITVQSLQNSQKETKAASKPIPEGNDFWNPTSYIDPQQPTFSLKQPPKWLKRPVGASFGFGGKLVSFTTEKGQPAGAPVKSEIKIQKTVVEPTMVAETEKFEELLKSADYSSVIKAKLESSTDPCDAYDWKVLLSLLEEPSKSKLIESLGYSENEISSALKKLGDISAVTSSEEKDAQNPSSNDKDDGGIFGESSGADEFLSGISAKPATAVSITLPTGSFTIFDGTVSEVDKLITQSLVLGNFEAAVDLCLKEDRLSDAFMMALSGNESCREKVRNAYFSKNLNGPSYIRVLSSIVNRNLSDLVENADISNWKEIVVALATYSEGESFNTFIEKIGDRLVEKRVGSSGDESRELRKSAAFCYITGSKLEKILQIWIEELRENERLALSSTSLKSLSPYGIHIKSLQDFIEKITVFREASKFVDGDILAANSTAWKLAPLYETYREYANIVTSQGFLDLGERFFSLLPSSYPLASIEKERVSKAKGKQSAHVINSTGGSKTTQSKYQVDDMFKSQPEPSTFYSSFGTGVPPAATTSVPSMTSYAPIQNPYQPAPSSVAQPGHNSAPGPSVPSSIGAPFEQYGQNYRSSISIPAPPPPVGSSPPVAVQPPTSYMAPPKDKSVTGWNDAPVLKASGNTRRSTPSAAPQPILSPFPNQAPIQTGGGYGGYTPPTTSGIPSRKPTPVNMPPPPIGAKPPQAMGRLSMKSPPASSAMIGSQFPPGVNGQLSAPGLPPSSSASAEAQLPNAFAPPQQAVNSRYAPSPSAAASPTNKPLNPYAPSQEASVASGQPAGQSATLAPPPTRPSNPYAAPTQDPQPSVNMQATHPPLGNGRQYAPSQAPASGPPAMAVNSPKVATQALPPQPTAPAKPKHPQGDRSHIPETAKPIFEILNAEMARIKQQIPATFARQVSDAEKRLNILFDHLNNEDLLSDESVKEMVLLSQAVQQKDYQTAHAIHINLMTTKTDECGQWMVGIKRLIDMSRALK